MRVLQKNAHHLRIFLSAITKSSLVSTVHVSWCHWWSSAWLAPASYPDHKFPPCDHSEFRQRMGLIFWMFMKRYYSASKNFSKIIIRFYPTRVFILKEKNLVTPLYEFLQMVIDKKHEIKGKERMEGESFCILHQSGYSLIQWLSRPETGLQNLMQFSGKFCSSS